MNFPARPIGLLAVVALVFGSLVLPSLLPAAPKPATYWQIDDIRPGMKGYGLTAFKGSKIDRFDAEVLGVLKNVNPGRDLVLVRLSGCDLDKSGVVAGMSGSPIYIENRLVGAIAYAWAYGKEPIAGVTPFAQMVEYVESYERRDMANKNGPKRVSLKQPFRAGGQTFDTVTVSGAAPDAAPPAAEGMWLAPLTTPLVASGFTEHSLGLFRERTRLSGITPVQSGSASPHVMQEEKETPLAPGSPLAVSLVSGDFDMSGIGTVTHIEGERVYGWGHPFMGVGTCEFPLMAGFIHTVYPRQSVSFKMGSPIRPVGVINADVSTCIAGWLERKADLLPVRMTIRRDDSDVRTFNCEVVRQKSLMPQLIYTALTNSVDMEGELPDELTAELEVRFEFEDRPALVIRDTYSGSSYSGGRAPAALYSQVAGVTQSLIGNPFELVRIKRIECDTKLRPGRISADVEAVQLDSETYAPGETVKASVFLKPYKGTRERVQVELKLPADLPEGTYSATICDDLANARQEIRESPVLNSPSRLEHVWEALKVQTAVKRNNLVLRVPVKDVGVALDGRTLPNLPASAVEMLANSRRTGAQTMNSALVSRQNTDWVIQGSQSVKFAVTKNKRLSVEP